LPSGKIAVVAYTGPLPKFLTLAILTWPLILENDFLEEFITYFKAVLNDESFKETVSSWAKQLLQQIEENNKRINENLINILTNLCNVTVEKLCHN
jgi:hypothetical protein